VKTGIQASVILNEVKDLVLGNEDYVAAKRRKKVVKLLLQSHKAVEIAQKFEMGPD
jgi:hypothetical protein